MSNTIPYTDFFMEAQAEIQMIADLTDIASIDFGNKTNAQSKARWLQGYKYGRRKNTERIIELLEQVAADERKHQGSLEAGILLAIYHIKGWHK